MSQIARRTEWDVESRAWVQNDEDLLAFESNFEGEWVGYSANFRPDGAVVPLPDYDIPTELLEWGVEIKGYEHLTSSAIAGDSGVHIRAHAHLSYTVSCCGVPGCGREQSALHHVPLVRALTLMLTAPLPHLTATRMAQR